MATVLYAMLTVLHVAWQGMLGYTMQHMAGWADMLHNYTKLITLQPTQCLAHGARLVREAVAVVYIMLH